MSLGSWRTYERISREQGVAVMQAAIEAGITFLDDARYDDETGTAPIPTGYSEVVFGELFRAARWARDDVVVANKLWWEHWPAEDAQAELDGSLGRMKFGHVDLIYAVAPPPSLSIATLVEQVGELLHSGRARAWGTCMWTGAQHLEALTACRRLGVPAPCAAQTATSLVDHRGVDDPEMQQAFAEGPISLVASHVLAGGALSGRASSRMENTGHEMVGRVVALANAWGVPPAHVAFAYAFSQPPLASVLFGASRPEQLHENVAAWGTFTTLDASQIEAVRRLAD